VRKTLLNLMADGETFPYTNYRKPNYYHAFDLTREIIPDDRTCYELVKNKDFCFCSDFQDFAWLLPLHFNFHLKIRLKILILNILFYFISNLFYEYIKFLLSILLVYLTLNHKPYLWIKFKQPNYENISNGYT